MTTAETIAEMKVLLEDRRKLQERLERARNAGTATGGAMDGMPHAKPREPRVEKYGCLAVEIAGEIKSLENILKGDRERVRKPIEAVGDVVLKRMLIMRYIDFKPVAEIVAETGYPRRYVYKLLDKALENWAQKGT